MMPVIDGIYARLGDAKSSELYQQYVALYKILEEGKRSRQIGGIVPEGIARDFIREFLPPQFGVKNGLVIDSTNDTVSPQIDAIIYEGSPLLEYTDVVIIEKQQVKALAEIKSWVAKNDVFGQKATQDTKVSVAGRDAETGLIVAYEERKPFLPKEAPYILLIFYLSSDSRDSDVVRRLKEICDMYVAVGRSVPRRRRQPEDEDMIYNFDHSASRLIEWLRNLS